MKNKTIFEKYIENQPLIDKYKQEKDTDKAVDVIIPVIHTNILWEQNLKSIYREIPVNRLLIGDGGCIDDSLKIAKKFPRVKVLNHRKYVSLGYSIKKLIEEVKTDWFIYLHSDVYLPEGWFNKMIQNQNKYDWFESKHHMSVLIDYPMNYTDYNRSLSGGQMGRKFIFKKLINRIDDDYLYRNEDLIFSDLVKQKGFKVGRADNAILYHQLMNKRSQWQRNITNVSFIVDRSKKENEREWIMQVKGIIKYTNPTDQNLIDSVEQSVKQLEKQNINLNEFRKWVSIVNPLWLPYLSGKIVLLVVDTNTYFTGLIEIARKLNDISDYTPFFYFSIDYPTRNKDLDTLNTEQIQYYCENGSEEKIRYIPKIFANLFPFRILRTYNKYRRKYYLINNILEKNKPVLVVLAADNIWYDTAIFIKIAHIKNIPSVIIPQWVANSKEPAEYIVRNAEYDAKKYPNKILTKIYSKWFIKYKDKTLIRLPAEHVLVKEWFKLTPPLPWILHSGSADKILLESRSMMKHLLNAGLEKDNLVVTGSVQNDLMAKHIRNYKDEKTSLYKRLKLSKYKPIILTALPPDFLYQPGGRPECEFKNYNSLANYWVKTLSELEDNYNIIVNLHPSVTKKEINYLKKYPVIISESNIIDLIPFCDFFVASVSATIQWAIVCSKPVINYDVYQYNYDDYANVKGVIHINNKSEFVRIINKIAFDKKFYKQITAEQKKSADDWGMLDGNSGKRIIKMFDRLTQKTDDKQ